MRIYGGDYSISYGADIEVFRNALLEIGGGVGANIGLTIVCGDKIKIGKNSGCGRNVTIRDNNGGHAISIRGYKKFSTNHYKRTCMVDRKLYSNARLNY